MKKIILLVISTLLLVACNSGLKGVEIDSETDMQKFTFTEDEFKKTYEENTGKVVPNSFKFNHSSIHIANVNADQVKDRKSTRLNSSHVAISYAVFCLKKKKQKKQ